MRGLLIIVIFLGQIPLFSQIDLSLDVTGKPEYRKLLPNRRAFQIYKKDTAKVFYMLGKNYYNFRGVSDTLEFLISGDSMNYSVQLQNDIDEFSVILEKDVLSFVSDDKRIEFELKISVSKQNTVHTPIMKNILKEDEELGMVITQNRLTRYAKVNLNNGTFNIAVLDKNKNGFIDKGDLLALSNDEYFMTAENGSCTFLNKETTAKVGSYFYKITWNGGYEFRLDELSNNESHDIVLSNYISDVTFKDGTSLSSLVSNNEYTIINIWSVYCSPCIKAIESLNALDNVIGIHLDEKNVDISRFDIKYSNFMVSKKQLDYFNVNGYPYYIIVNKEMEIIAKYRSFHSIDNKYK